MPHRMLSSFSTFRRFLDKVFETCLIQIPLIQELPLKYIESSAKIDHFIDIKWYTDMISFLHQQSQDSDTFDFISLDIGMVVD